jgi:hypothetical protein
MIIYPFLFSGLPWREREASLGTEGQRLGYILIKINIPQKA